MSTKFGDLFNALSAEFHPGDVKTRPGEKFAPKYITARTVANRLDEVLGWENWECEVVPFSPDAVKCTITIDLGGRKISKSAVGAKSRMSQKSEKVSPGHDDKGGDSDAFKRAASLFGVGRYLYNDGVMHYPDPRDDGLAAGDARRAAPQAENTRSKGEKLADWATRHGHYQRATAIATSNYSLAVEHLGDEAADAVYNLLKGSKALAHVPQPPAKEPPPPPQAQPRGPTNENGNPVDFGWPHSGSALFAWAKQLEKAYSLSLVKAVDGEFCKPDGWGREWKSWVPEQVEQAAVFVAKRVRLEPGYDGQFDRRIPDVLKLKGDICGAAVKLLRAHGTAEPAQDDIARCINAIAADLEPGWGGETLGDFHECEDDPKLKQMLDQMNKDLEESELPF